MIQQQHVRGTRWFGNYCCCCCSSPAILPAVSQIYLAYDTIVMGFLSSRPFHCFLSSIYTTPLHTRPTSYWQYYELIYYHTIPLGSNLSLLRSLSASFTCLTGMRGAAGGRQSATAKPRWYAYVLLYVWNFIVAILKTQTFMCALRETHTAFCLYRVYHGHTKNPIHLFCTRVWRLVYHTNVHIS